MSRRYIRVVGAMLEREEGRYLITQRRASASLPLLWEFPGGRVEEGESDQEALARELGGLRRPSMSQARTWSMVVAGNVAVGAEIGIRAGAFQIAIGFAHTRADAEEVARAVLQKGAGNVRQMFERAWRTLPDLPPALSKVSGDEGMLARASLTVLRCLEDKSHAGAFIASPATPWGETNHDGNHVYHLVWPRDLCRMATAPGRGIEARCR